jgi:hypothetical protein
MSEPKLQGKTQDIPKHLVWDAWLAERDVVHRYQPLCHGAPPQPPGRRVPP